MSPQEIAAGLSAVAKAKLLWHVRADEHCGSTGHWAYTEPLPESLYEHKLAERERARGSIKTRITPLGRAVAEALTEVKS